MIVNNESMFPADISYKTVKIRLIARRWCVDGRVQFPDVKLQANSSLLYRRIHYYSVILTRYLPA